MSVVLFVRVQSDLQFEERERRLLERKPGFLEVPGLIQKIYGRDPATGAVCGIYFFENSEVLYPLRPDVGPLGDASGGA